ncbi:MAG: crossover junction endodeoxyribonuclease RuvC [Chloroflexota bacterium]
MIVLGVDPGTAITGFGIISADGDRLDLVDYGCIRTEAREGITRRLRDIHSAVNHLIAAHRPDLLAIEELFFNRNVTTAIAVGQARGVVLLAAALAGLEVVEFTPPQVKQGVCGYGRADKKQVQSMVRAILGLREIPKPDDAADALAVAIAGANGRLRAALVNTGAAANGVLPPARGVRR